MLTCVMWVRQIVSASCIAQASMAKSPLAFNPWDRAATLTQICWSNWARMIAATRLAIASPCWSMRPASYKMLAQSKTFGKWKASYATWARRRVLSGFWMLLDDFGMSLGRSGALSCGKGLYPGHPCGHRSNCGSTQRCPKGQAEWQCAEVRSQSSAKAWRWRALQKQPDLPAAPVWPRRGLFPCQNCPVRGREVRSLSDSLGPSFVDP